MKTKEFLETLPDLLRQQLPPELAGFQVHPRVTSLTKFYYGKASIHYEVWIQKRKGIIELGLHFEGEPESNFRHLELLKSLLPEIHNALGDTFEIEEWDRGWTRAYEDVALEPLTDDFLVEVSFKMVAMMQALEPLLRSEPLP